MSATEQHAVVIFLKLSDDEFGSFEERQAIFGLEERIATSLKHDGTGEYDGHEFSAGWAKLYVYGPDCRRLAERVIPLLREFAPLAGSYLIQRQGAPGSSESTVTL